MAIEPLKTFHGGDDMAKPTNINMVVRDGLTTCANNDGVEIIFKIPRKDLAKCHDRDELKHSGIYFLLGERNGRQMIHIGQTVKNLFGQLNEHDREADKNFWTEAIVFTTADNSFGARELVWLEDKFFDELKSAGRLVFKIDDDNQISDFEVHSEFACTTLKNIGCKIFEQSSVTESNEEIFYLKRYVKRIERTITAKMKRTPTGYRVLAGSEICPKDADYLSNSSKIRRRKAKVDANGILREEVELTSPSTAAEFVVGNNANGHESWKTRDGEPLKNFL